MALKDYSTWCGEVAAEKYCHVKKYSVTRSQKLIYYLTCIVYLEFYEPIVQISVKTQLD